MICKRVAVFLLAQALCTLNCRFVSAQIDQRRPSATHPSEQTVSLNDGVGGWQTPHDVKTVHTAADMVHRRVVSFTAETIPLKAAVEQLARSASLKVRWDDESLRSLEIDSDKPVTMTVSDHSIPAIVIRLIGQCVSPESARKIRTVFRNDELIVTSRDAIQERMKQVLPEWMHAAYVRGDFFPTLDDDDQIESLRVTNGMTDEALSRICTLTPLKHLTIGGKVSLTSAGTARLSDLHQLTSLTLQFDSPEQNDCADALLEGVSSCKTLSGIALLHSGATDRGIEYLESLPQLKMLCIDGEGRLTNASLESIGKLHQLTKLSLINSPGQKLGWMRFAEGAFGPLDGLTKLEYLNLPKHHVSPLLFRSERLKQLDLGGSVLNNTITSPLAANRDLVYANLYFDSVTDDAFEPFVKHPALRCLCLATRKIGDRALSRLKDCPQLAEVRLETKGLTDTSLKYLANLKSLKNLDFNWSDNQFTWDGVQSLGRLPHLEILTLRITNFGSGSQHVLYPASRKINEFQKSFAPHSSQIRNLDVDLLSSTFPKTMMRFTFDDFDPRNK